MVISLPDSTFLEDRHEEFFVARWFVLKDRCLCSKTDPVNEAQTFCQKRQKKDGQKKDWPEAPSASRKTQKTDGQKKDWPEHPQHLHIHPQGGARGTMPQ